MFKFYYWGPLLFHTKLDGDVLKKINKLCHKNEHLNCKGGLAGHIQGEYLVDSKKLEKVLKNSFKKFNEIYQHWYNSNDDFYIDNSWVNYMKKGEYNPVHIHDTCDISAVLYLSVPDEIKKENETFVGSDLGPGSIKFIMSSYTPNFITQKSFMPETGDMFMFPAHLMHMVAPFKSDVERVSVAFNMKRKI